LGTYDSERMLKRLAEVICSVGRPRFSESIVGFRNRWVPDSITGVHRPVLAALERIVDHHSLLAIYAI
jgi:hypothetical protein